MLLLTCHEKKSNKNTNAMFKLNFPPNHFVMFALGVLLKLV